jgi:DNA-binding CsgD family transcriptional regulator
LRRRAGQLRDAEADAQTALAAAAGAGWGGAGRTALTMLVGSLLDQGRTQDAASEMAGVDAVPDAPSLNQLLIEQMRLRAAQGQHRQALAAWDEARRRAVRHFTGIDPSWVPDLLAAADSHHALGEVDERDALLSEAVALAEHWGTPGFIGQARHRMARLRGGEDAVGDLAGAVEVLRGSPARLELARALLSLGEVLRRHGRRVQSRDPLREAYDLARQCGANGLAETARAELRASGIRLRREALSGVDALTAGERRIADMAASGASNAEIAQTLFLTVKTVESHLTSCYRKLDISRRSQLQGALEPKSQGRGSGSSPSRSACG